MKLSRIALLIAITLSSVSAAHANAAMTTASVNMRKGPGTQFPVVLAIPSAQRIWVHGCERSGAWCSVNWGGREGWVSAIYLAGEIDAIRPPIVVGPALAPRGEVRRDARIENRVERRMERRWNRWMD